MSAEIDVMPDSTRQLALSILRAARACRRASERLGMPVAIAPYWTTSSEMLVYLEVAGIPVAGVDVRDVPEYAADLQTCAACFQHVVPSIPHACCGGGE